MATFPGAVATVELGSVNNRQKRFPECSLKGKKQLEMGRSSWWVRQLQLDEVGKDSCSCALEKGCARAVQLSVLESPLCTVRAGPRNVVKMHR